MMEYKILGTKNGQAFYHIIYNWQDAEIIIEEFLRSGCTVEVWHGDIKFVPSLKQEKTQ